MVQCYIYTTDYYIALYLLRTLLCMLEHFKLPEAPMALSYYIIMKRLHEFINVSMGFVRHQGSRDIADNIIITWCGKYNTCVVLSGATSRRN